jgi:hypothetical protein
LIGLFTVPGFGRNPPPMPWQLDGGEMDDDFAFPFCRTRK